MSILSVKLENKKQKTEVGKGKQHTPKIHKCTENTQSLCGVSDFEWFVSYRSATYIY